MTDVPDAELLEQFARNDSETAFATLVERHIGLVHSVARRHTANPQHAQDITQAVFIILARKAAALGRKTVLPGWLYHTARLTAANFQRAETSRIRREQEAFMQSAVEEPVTDALWRELCPQLDEAMACLGASERDALVLRYFQNKSMADVGRLLGLEENTAQKRIGRALEKLRKFFSKRGVASTTAMIAGAISANSVQAAPAGLAKIISAAAIAKSAAASASTLTLVKGAIKIMTWTKMNTAVATGIVILLAAATVAVSVREVQGHKANSAAARGQTRSTQALLISSEFVEVPDRLLGHMNVQGEAVDANTTSAILSGPEYTNLMAALKTAGATALSSPRIAFTLPMPGGTEEGNVSIRRAVKIAGTNANVGTKLDVKVSLSSDSRLANLDLITQRDWLAETTAGQGTNEIRTTKAVVSAALQLNPGQTLLIQSAAAGNELAADGSDNSKSLLVFVTPRIEQVKLRLQKIQRTARQ